MLRARRSSVSSLHASSTVRSSSLHPAASFLHLLRPSVACGHPITAVAVASCASHTAAVTAFTFSSRCSRGESRPKSGTQPASTASSLRHCASPTEAASAACSSWRASSHTFLNGPLPYFIGTTFSMLRIASTMRRLIHVARGVPSHPTTTCCSVASGSPVWKILLSGLLTIASRLSLSAVVIATRPAARSDVRSSFLLLHCTSRLRPLLPPSSAVVASPPSSALPRPGLGARSLLPLDVTCIHSASLSHPRPGHRARLHAGGAPHSRPSHPPHPLQARCNVGCSQPGQPRALHRSSPL